MKNKNHYHAKEYALLVNVIELVVMIKATKGNVSVEGIDQWIRGNRYG